MAAGSTYTKLASTTVSGTSTTEVQFSSISGAYTDLIIIGNLGAAVNSSYPAARFNSDTGSNYTVTNLYGLGSSALSDRSSTRNIADISYEILDDTGINTNIICHIMNYSNTTTYKNMLSRTNNTANGTSLTAVLWRSTAAINNIKLYTATGNGSNLYAFANGSTFAIYGIAAA